MAGKHAIEIDELLQVISVDKAVAVFMDAFEKYPKLMGIFPEKNRRMPALETTLRFYLTYDFFYGRAYTLDEEVNEMVVLLDSRDMSCSAFRCLRAGCYSNEYQDAKEKMPIEDRKLRLAFFKELEKLEDTVPLPKKSLYIDFLGVVQARQGEGRGKKLMDAVCRYADRQNLPLVLFTNSERSREFYERLGFSTLRTVASEKFKFTNAYMIREPRTA